ncbi:3-oxoacyl-ACP reductase [Ramlibacter monticola]|uniref:3-oxoacyl-ACP reductase n=1 Tax=Ramlibacter monticola TaxID=1926872 RepID=A0A937CTI5_9BURK|nr:3-oxoacyl-ACP reductase [Ramlibacter monticola]MBL0392610.1 3-oxoacyl-ACP reductase [Ramlibacter monticola]
MPDRLVSLANHPLTRPLVRGLGLPQPARLARSTQPYRPLELQGRSVLVAAVPAAGLAETVRRAVVRLGGVLEHLGCVQAVIVDATGCSAVDQLRELYDLLHPALGRLDAHGRVLLLADGEGDGAEAAACARAVEGLTRSLAKEIGRHGATANALRIRGAWPQGLDAALSFFCTDRSAFVSGQVLDLRSPTPEVERIAQPAFHGRVAVVTGAAGAIGAATARRLAQDGASVACVDVPSSAGRLAALAEELGGQALPLDLTVPEASARLGEFARGLGGIDILVHNAGITRDRTLAKMSGREWDSVLDVNLRAVLAIDAALDRGGAMKPAAREICLASISGIAGNAGQANYAASKAALIGYTAARARELAPRGGTANAVAPGFIETEMTRRIPWMLRQVGRRLNALQQGGLPEDVAEAIAFLARSDAQAVTGQTLRVCGQSFLGA